jgi:hypothetical protein
MSQRPMITLVVVIAIVVTGALAVMAQDDDDTPPPYGPGMMWDEDGFGPGMMWGDGESMMVAVAEVLGLEPEAFFAALREGQTLTELAEAQGVELEAVYDAMIDTAETHMADLVAAGVFTQAEADSRLDWMRENIAEMPMFDGGGFGPCMGGMRGGFGSGMMGSGYGMMGRGYGMPGRGDGMMSGRS